jgi:group I intron endonuclease
MIGIYKITNPQGKSYIGQSKNIDKRIKSHKYGDCKKNRKFYQSVLEYGWENHYTEILCECDINDLNKFEEHFILLHNSVINGLNLSSGGKSPKYSDDSKFLMSLQRKGVKPTIEALEKRKIGRDKNLDKFLNAMRTTERKKQVSQQKSKTVQIIDGEKVSIFNSCIQASLHFKIDKASIARFARGERKHKHLKFEYI